MRCEGICGALVSVWLAIAPMGCGANDDASIDDEGDQLATSAQAYEDASGFWIDDNRVIAQRESSTVEFGHDAGGRYIATNHGKRYAYYGNRDLGYKVNYAGSGVTQWVAFDFIGNNFFGPVLAQGGHIPIFLRAGSLRNATTEYEAEGKGIFLGRNDAFYGTCGAPDAKARIFFETRVMNKPLASAIQSHAAAAGVKCGDWYADKFFEDQVKYRLEMHANATHIAYWIYRYDAWGNMTLWSANGTEALDYSSGTAMNDELIAAKNTWLPTEYARMNTDNAATLAMALVLLPNVSNWTLRITNLASGRF